MDVKSIFFATLLLSLAACSSSSVNERAELFYTHGTSKLIEKEYTEALDYLLKAAELAPDSKIMNNLGMAYFFKDQYTLAEKHFEKALTYDSKNSDARNNLASLYFKTNRLSLAEREYKKVLEDLIYMDTYRVYYNLALISEKRGNIREANDFLKLSVKNKEDYCPANFKLGQLASNSLKLKEALDHFKKASKGACYELPAPHFEQAVIYAKLGETKKAHEKFAEIMARFPTSELSARAEQNIRLLGKSPHDTTFEEQILKEHEEALKQSRSEGTSTPQF